MRALRFVALVVLLGSAHGASAQGDATRGAYLAKAAGCVGCHTEAKDGATPYAGGRALKTPFGTFYGPNITPHASAGLGRWTDADFVRALRLGLRPDGAHYFPAFPYPSFTRITDSDMRDLWAYLRTLPPSARPNQSHELRFPFGWRFLVWGWKWLFFSPGVFSADPKRAPLLERGAYLVEALGHCGECHTPRNALGGLDRARWLGGAANPSGKGTIPNITPAKLTWSEAEILEYLTTGFTPDYDVVGGQMAHVVENMGKLPAGDRQAVAAYLKRVPGVP